MLATTVSTYSEYSNNKLFQKLQDEYSKIICRVFRRKGGQTKISDIKIDEIEAAMLQEVQSHALEQYGIQVHELRLKRVGLPATNVQSVFTQMQADRQKYIDQLLAEGERDAQIIMSESDAEVAAIVAEGREEAAAINAETEREVAEIYASAHSQDPELYEFLQKLAALENSVDEDTVMIITMDTPPFDVLYGDD